MKLPADNIKSLPIALATLLLQLVLLLPAAKSQHYYPHAHRQLYYDSPPARLRRFEYVPNPFVAGYVAPPAVHYQQQTPNFQLINYRPSYQPLALEYQQQQPPVAPQAAAAPVPVPVPAPAPPLPSLYPQSSVQYQQRAAPQAELAKYRYEGNYLPIQQRVAVAPRRVEDQLYNVPPALFTSDVLHVVPSRAAAVQHQQEAHAQAQAQADRPRRFAADAVAAESRADHATPSHAKEVKYFHDIFMRFDGPHGRSSGHVVEHPHAQERRFETQRGTNRYKGEVIWTDRRGAHGEHRWDMAQGKL
ncbi:uncharacterized protein LOC132792827 [Drosophila nasuta]|uniref:uncharacterized protein LOC132792827 n=1 Tax=Drosophila nasuta TaxID=42062 RepID=UPI00295EE110|nr:uncharacterized protein LOC132792827 [Drosophila nasuta]